MKHIGIVKADTLVSIMNWIGGPAFLVYAICMLIAPWFAGGWNWHYVQNVWDRWQTMNAGFSALISGVIAFNISKFTVNRQRERQFVAARAFLPHSLSDLTAYCKSSSIVLREAWGSLAAPNTEKRLPLTAEVPQLPQGYKETFGQCIGVGEPEVGDYLAHILVELQVHHSRLNELRNSLANGSRTVLNQRNLTSYLFSLGQLQALINKIFNFARGMESFDASKLAWEDYRNAYANLDIDVDDIEGLEGFTRRAIARTGET